MIILWLWKKSPHCVSVVNIQKCGESIILKCHDSEACEHVLRGSEALWTVMTGLYLIHVQFNC